MEDNKWSRMKILESQKAKRANKTLYKTIWLQILGDFHLTIDFSAETKTPTTQIYDTK